MPKQKLLFSKKVAINSKPESVAIIAIGVKPEVSLALDCGLAIGQRGHAATRLLRELGYEAINLDGGYMTWSNSPASKSLQLTN